MFVTRSISRMVSVLFNVLIIFSLLIASASWVTPAYAAWIFHNKTTANGLGHNTVWGVFSSGSMVYAATSGGLSISTDGGSTFVNRTTANGLGHNEMRGVFASGSTIYASTVDGLSISTDGGSTFVNKTMANGLGHNFLWGIFADGGTVYAATQDGLSISTDGGSTFANKTTANGLGDNFVWEVLASGSTVYAATTGGLSISTDGGSTFVNRTTANGLGHNIVLGVFVSGSTVYAATFNGLSISTDGGSTFVNRTTGNGLGNSIVRGVFASGSTIYAATDNGLSISTDGGNTFANQTTADGLGNNFLWGVFADGSTVYAATAAGLSIGFPDADTTPPTVDSIVRASSNPTLAASVNFTVSFSEPVMAMSVDASDFVITTTGVSGAAIGMVGGSGATYTISVDTGTGSGEIHLDVSDNDSIVDLSSNPLGGAGAGNGDFTAGEYFTIPGPVLYAAQGGLTTGFCNTWANGCELRYALSIAVSGQEIWAGAGIYKPTSGTDRTATFTLKNGVAIYGGFDGTETLLSDRDYVNNITILSGDLSGNDGANFTNYGENSYHIVTGGGTNDTAVLDGFTITGGYADGGNPHNNGGGMLNLNSSSTFNNLIFIYNYAYIGGGMSNQNGSNSSLTNVSFISNLAGTSGGGMYNHTSNPTLTDVTFSNNTSFNIGGGVRTEFGSPILIDVTFTGNSATNYGGGMANNSTNASLINITFSDNTAYVGGGLYNENGSNADLTNVSFSNNEAGTSGGGMYNYTSNPTLTDVRFINNTSANIGGGMRNEFSSPQLTNVTFTGNSATNSGGAMMNNSVNGSLTNVTFSNNTASIDGGGMFNTNSSNPTLADVTFMGNTAGNDGGGMYNENNSSPVLAGVTFNGNSAASGGGMLNYINSAPSITNVTFANNTASDGGGLYNHTSSSPSLKNVTFNNNTATNNGGGIFNAYSSNATIQNSILWGNNTQVFNISSTPVISDSLVQGGYAGGTNIINADPLLGALADNGGSTQTMALAPGSPVIDAGNNSTCAMTDQRGVVRPQGIYCDIGAYEAQFAPAPVTGEVVISNLPILDTAAIGFIYGQAFTMGPTSIGINQVKVRLRGPCVTPPPVTLRRDSGGIPGATLVTFSGPASIPNNQETYTFTTPSFSLTANTKYWLVVDSSASGGCGWSGDGLTDPTGLYATHSGGAYFASSIWNSYSQKVGFEIGGNSSGGSCSSSVTVTSNADSGPGSLRQALADVCQDGTINFDPSLSGATINLASTLDIYDGVTIDGSSLIAQITISGDTDDNGIGDIRLFRVNSGISVILNSLTLTKGFVNTSTTSAGAIQNYGNLTILNSTFSDNHAYAGGAIYNHNTLTIANSTFISNQAHSNRGGAVSSQGTLIITNSTFGNNSSQQPGGAILSSDFATLTIRNSTFSGNSNSFGNGSAIFVSGGSFNLYNTIIASSSGIACGGSAPTINIGNLIQDGSCSASLSGDPELEVLADNGGPTQTMALGAGSSAIDAGNNAACAATDQRGVTRPFGTNCDIGAYEYNFTNSAPQITEGASINSTMSEDGSPTAFSLTLHATDVDGDVLNWSIASPAGHGTASVNGTGTTQSITYDPSPEYYGSDSFDVRVDDGDLGDTITVNVTIQSVNDAPVNISLLSSNVNEGLPVGATVGSFSTTDVDTLDTHAYSLVSGGPLCPGTDNASFSIGGEDLRTASVFDASVQNQYAICVRSTDDGTPSRSFEKAFNITVNDVTAPQVVSILRANVDPTSSTSVEFTVTFSETVLGVNSSDFTLTTTGVSGAAVSGVSGTGASYTVTVYTGTGNGTIRLNVVDDDTIVDAVFNPLSVGFATGEVYTVNKGAAAPPSRPTLLSPASGSVTVDYTPLLDWVDSTVPGGTIFSHYQIQLATDSGFTVITLDENISGIASSSFTPLSDLASNTRFYWRVRSVNAHGNASTWSVVRNFRAAVLPPVLLTPADAEQLLSNRPTFDWEDVAGATNYRIQIADNVGFSPMLTNAAVTPSTYTPTADLPFGATLFWRIQVNATNGPNFSEIRTLTTANPPGIPGLTSPANNAKVSGPSPLFAWGVVSVPAGTTFDHYQIQIATSTAFTTIMHDNNLVGLSNTQDNTAVLASGTTYHWRVRAFNTLGQSSAWSAVRPVRIIFAAPTLIQPASGSTVSSLTPTLEWSPIAGAATYRIQISRNISATPIPVVINQTGISATNFVPATNLLPTTTYYWRVRVNTPTSTYAPGEWSAWFVFVTP